MSFLARMRGARLTGRVEADAVAGIAETSS